MELSVTEEYKGVFSRKNLKRLINGNLTLSHTDKITYAEYFDQAYLSLTKHYRNEYLYKNALLNRRLLGVHSINTGVALSEIPIEGSVADFILINGKAVVYEIKTELDDFSRLLTQLEDYYQAFQHVYVVTAESMEERLKNILKDSPAGIILFRKNGNFSKPVKESIQHTAKLNHVALFKLLRKKEYLDLTKELFSSIPNVKPVFLFDACLERFKEVEINTAYQAVMKQLKKRNIKEKTSFKKIPESIKSLVYFEDLTKREYEKLNLLLKSRTE